MVPFILSISRERLPAASLDYMHSSILMVFRPHPNSRCPSDPSLLPPRSYHSLLSLVNVRINNQYSGFIERMPATNTN